MQNDNKIGIDFSSVMWYNEYSKGKEAIKMKVAKTKLEALEKLQQVLSEKALNRKVGEPFDVFDKLYTVSAQIGYIKGGLKNE